MSNQTLEAPAGDTAQAPDAPLTPASKRKRIIAGIVVGAVVVLGGVFGGGVALGSSIGGSPASQFGTGRPGGGTGTHGGQPPTQQGTQAQQGAAGQ